MPGVKGFHGRRTAMGTIHGFLAQALMVPTGLLTAAFLTRKLGPELYGLLTVSAGIVLWIEMSVTWMFSRTTVKFVAEAEDWRAVTFAVAAAAEMGVKLETELVRGGTDGSRLSELGLPTPNVFDGGYDYHSRFEWNTVQNLEASLAYVKQLVRYWAEHGGDVT